MRVAKQWYGNLPLKAKRTDSQCLKTTFLTKVPEETLLMDVEGNCVDDEGTCGAALPTKEERCQGRDDVVVLVSNVSDLVDGLKPYVIHR